MNKKIKRFHEELKKAGKEKGKSSVIVYFVLRALVITCMILEFLRGDLNNAFLCLLSVLFYMVKVQRFHVSFLVQYIVPHIAGLLPDHMRSHDLCRACRLPLQFHTYSLFLIAVQLPEQVLILLCVLRHSCLLFLRGRNFAQPPHKMDHN